MIHVRSYLSSIPSPQWWFHSNTFVNVFHIQWGLEGRFPTHHLNDMNHKIIHVEIPVHRVNPHLNIYRTCECHVS